MYTNTTTKEAKVKIWDYPLVLESNKHEFLLILSKKYLLPGIFFAISESHICRVHSCMPLAYEEHSIGQVVEGDEPSITGDPVYLRG